MTTEFNDLYKFELLHNKKTPSGPWKEKSKWYKGEPRFKILNKKFGSKVDDKNPKKSFRFPNCAIVTGHSNDLIAVDLDSYKWSPDHIFYKKFGKDISSLWNTRTQLTPRGGYHYFFKYDPDIYTTTNKDHEIDIRSNGGYIIASGSCVDDKSYTTLNDSDIMTIPDELKEFLIEFVTPPKIKRNNITINKKTTSTNHTNSESSQYSYNIGVKQLTTIINKLPNDYIAKRDSWLKFTTAMKILNQYDLWDKLSKKHGGNSYNYTNNMTTWNTCDTTLPMVDIMFKDAGQDEMLNLIKYKKVLPNTITSSNKINRAKLGYVTASDYIEKLGGWVKFTTEMKKLKKYDHWEKISREHWGESYNYNDNLITWATCDTTTPIIDIVSDDKDGIVIEPDVNYAIRSDTGTGKTTLIKRVFNNPRSEYNTSGEVLPLMNLGRINKRDTTLIKPILKPEKPKFISIVSRVSLADEQYLIFGNEGIDCTHYDYPPCILKGSSLITTIDSIRTTDNLLEDIGEYIVFVDEVNSVIEYILQADACLSKYRGECLKTLIYIIKNCKQFIVVDADISDLVFNLIDHVERKYKFIDNDYKHNSGVQATEIFSYDELVKLIQKEDKYIVCCDSATVCKDLARKIGHSDIKCITADTVRVGSLDDYDKIIYSPKIIYGLDSSMKRKVFIYMEEHTISPRNILQQIARCRDIEHLYYTFGKKTFMSSKWDTFVQCKAYMKERISYGKRVFSPVEGGGQILEDLFNKMLIRYSYNQDCYNTNKYVHVVCLLRERGFTLTGDDLKVTGKLNMGKAAGECLKIDSKNFDPLNVNVQRVNDQYFKLSTPQIVHMKNLFLKPKLLSQVFTLKSYFDYRETMKGTKIISKDGIQEYSQETLSRQDDFSVKKIDSNKMKFILIEKVRKLTKCEITEKLDHVIKCEEFSISDMAGIMSEYEHVFNKPPPVVETPYNAEQLLSNMYKNTFGKEMTISHKVRENKITKSRYFLNPKYDAYMMVCDIGICEKKNEDEFETGTCDITD
jgi:hypothetical protein